MINPDALRKLILEQLDAEIVEVKSADNVHFYVTVVSKQFEGLSKIAQHKLVKNQFSQAFADESIHAMSLKTYTPEKWAEKVAKDAQAGNGE